jgi:ribosomal protein L31
VYAPSKGRELYDNEHSDLLDEIFEIATKFKETHTVALCGDMNASLHCSKPDKRDREFQAFCSEVGLHLSKNYPRKSTFKHSGGQGESQIDYIITTSPNSVEEVQILDEHPLNTSDHVPVVAEIVTNIKIVAKSRRPSVKIQKKLLWNRGDLLQYKENLEKKLRDIPIQDPERAVFAVTKALKESTKEAIPERSTRISKCIQPWNQTLRALSQVSKEQHKQWVDAGRPNETNNPVKISMKNAKSNFRKELRRTDARIREEQYTKIMNASSNDNQLFYQLIRNQRTKKREKHTSVLIVNSQTYEGDDEVTKGWAKYFEQLGKPQESKYFNTEYRDQVTKDVDLLEAIAHHCKIDPTPFSTKEVADAIKVMTNNKAADSKGIMAEHLKYGGQLLVSILKEVFNIMITTTQYPAEFKLGQITPIHKKGAINNPDLYRKVTIISIVGKTFERLYMTRITPKILEFQSRLQFGFTQNASPNVASVIITEAIQEATMNQETLYIAFMDTKKAFDVVSHDALLRKLHMIGVKGKLWLIARSMYREMVAQVKWAGYISEKFQVQQGLLQGGVGSAGFHKTYENPLLLRLEKTNTGLKIGTVYIGTVTVADDKTLLDKTPEGLQMGLDIATRYANNERYVNGVEKSQIQIINSKDGNQRPEWTINDDKMTITDQYTHLGINRTTQKETIACDTIKKARRTTYSLMGSGLHGVNGINPIISNKMWNTFVIPRSTYGLECMNIPPKEMANIEIFERKILKQAMGLPQNTANPIPYLLLGALPITAHIHKRRLGLLGAILRKQDSTEYQLAYRQMAIRNLNDNSWFQETERLLLNYELPSTHDMLENPPTKEAWKTTVKQAIEKKQMTILRENIKTKSTAKYINTDVCSFGKAHPVWTTVDNNVRDVQRAGIKAKLLSGTYLLQAHRARFNQFANNICPLCEAEAEDTCHFILRCSKLETIRKRYMREIEEQFIETNASDQWKYIVEDDEHLMQTVMDVSNLRWLIGDQLPCKIEPITRRFCYALHAERSTLVTQTASRIPRKKKRITAIRREKPKKKITSKTKLLDGAP